VCIQSQPLAVSPPRHIRNRLKRFRISKEQAFSTLPRVPFLPSGGHSAVDLPTASRACPGNGRGLTSRSTTGTAAPPVLEMVLDERTAMEPSPAAAVTRFLIRFGRSLLQRRPAGGFEEERRATGLPVCVLRDGQDPAGEGRIRRRPMPADFRASGSGDRPRRGASAHSPGPRRQPAGPGAPGPGRAFGRSRRGGPVDAGQPAQGRSRARTGVVRPPGGTVRFGDAAAAWCGNTVG
jgi:hypothetical protein